MRKRQSDIIIFLLSTVALIISARIFWNMGIYVDEYGTSPNIVMGGEFWLLMDWLRLFILLVLSIFSLIRIFSKKI